MIKPWSTLACPKSLDKSWLVYSGLIGVIAGVVIGVLWSALALPWWLGLVAVMLLPNRTLSRLAVALLLGLWLGQWRGAMVWQQASQYQALIGQSVEVIGRVVGDPRPATKGGKVVTLGEVEINHQPRVGQIQVMLRPHLLLHRGDYLLLRGQLETGRGAYQATIRRVQTAEVVAMADPATGLRDGLERRLQRFLPTQSAGLVSAIVLGKRVGVNCQLSRQIRTVGLSHIVVASGLHLMLVVAAVRPWLGRRSRRWEWWGSLAVAGLFALTAGLTASMTRALAALAVSLTVWFYGRRLAGWRLIILLVATSLLINPLYLLGDLSWWLSYGAFFGVLVVVPTVQTYLFGDRELSSAKRLLLAVLVVQAVVSPIGLVAFGEISLISPLANLLVVPLLLLLMWLSGLVILLADWSLLAGLVAYPLQLVSGYILTIITSISQVPGALLELKLNHWQVAVWVVVLGLVIAWMSYQNWRLRLKRQRQRQAELLATIPECPKI